jgi:hypothetical protein
VARINADNADNFHAPYNDDWLHDDEDEERIIGKMMVLSPVMYRTVRGDSCRNTDLPGLRIRIGSGFNQVSGSGSGFGIRIRIQEGKNGPQK